MSKKKGTMTLKDFHGGSIPSDLPLPSAPGITRGGINQQTTWGNSMGRSDHRLRPASTGSARNLDEKTPFFNHSSHIGRNFDEDERKPLDGVSGPRRVANDGTIRSQPVSSKEPKIDFQPSARVVSRPASVPVSQSSNQNYPGSRNYGSNYLNMGGNAAGSHPNAWGVGKEALGVKDPVSAAWSASDAATKLAHASALEKISSGRWSSKPQVNPLKDAEGYGHQETEREVEYTANSSYSKKTYNKVDLAADPDSYDVALMMHTERSLAVADGIRGSGKEALMYERSGPTVNMEPYIKNSYVTVSGSQPLQPSGRSSGTLSTFSSDSSERPKLKLLPRSKPLENLEPIGDHKRIIDHLRVEDSFAVQESKSRVQPGFAEPVVGDRAPERPKLNLKPRTQPLEQLEGNGEAKRGTVFGGARPREVVLKERGIEEDVSQYDSLTPPRAKEGVPKPETTPTDLKLAKYTDRRDPQMDGEMQRKNRQNETRRNNKDNEKQHRNQQQKQLQQDRPPSPETWRKPVEDEKQASHDGPPMRYGKVASAVELAQAFSKSVSNPTVADRFSGPRGIPSRSNNQVPFSRLTGPAPRPQINGY